MLHLFRNFSCQIDDLSWWFTILTPKVCKTQTCLCAWRQIETLIWSTESLPLSYSLSSICSCSLQGILDHRADCWPLRRGKQWDSWAPITRPNRCSGDLERKWMGKERKETEGERWCGRKGNRGMIEAGKNKLKHWCKNSETSLAILCQRWRWAEYFPLSLGHRSSFVFYIDSPTSLSAVGLMPLISWLSLP